MFITTSDMFGGKCDIISLFILFAKMYPFPFVVTEICKPLPFGSTHVGIILKVENSGLWNVFMGILSFWHCQKISSHRRLCVMGRSTNTLSTTLHTRTLPKVVKSDNLNSLSTISNFANLPNSNCNCLVWLGDEGFTTMGLPPAFKMEWILFLQTLTESVDPVPISK
ncbi:Met1p [Saccharomyces cerevisiae VL3]|uniref:Met1p n=2 Tax=Saccharomyces TaxID=4930 RepID=H0GJN9_SACCK|nr:hypothetical protein AWRI1631_112910 [Saccharomyces cerevisiae AWRI1631]EGA57830.1 Met1p [Saccharomyces cerevisiae FostersB]EGA81924.1 Met1p [Saccharomyces cerevisiae Lalvin QA23]EGA86027.1 Met1p [Saccharomyces cerevisiae VL3]EHN05965.1 Met1p [Saccharomyces cerevisiae x Saccharomyces kudriavzevii VIN7]